MQIRSKVQAKGQVFILQAHWRFPTPETIEWNDEFYGWMISVVLLFEDTGIMMENNTVVSDVM